MAILRRRPAPPSESPAAQPATGELSTEQAPKPHKAVRRGVLGIKPAVPITIGIVDKTDYREVVKRYKDKVKNPKTAIRAKCVECSGGSLKEVQLCPVTECALHPFRMGLNPFNKKTQARLSRDAEAHGDDAHDDDEDDDDSDGPAD